MSTLQILIVTGGSKALNEPLDSSEIYRDNVWRTIAGKMPFEITALRAVSYNNRVLSFGNTYQYFILLLYNHIQVDGNGKVQNRCTAMIFSNTIKRMSSGLRLDQ